MSSLSPTPQQPFAGLRVLECATVLAGPAVGAFFAELGAEVIKIEPPGGDVTRHWKLPSEDPESSVSAYFSAVNWGKQSVVLDLKSELDTFYELVKGADIVIANYKPGAAERLKVDYATLHTLNPRLLYAHLTGYGSQNPRTGYDAIIQAESGFLYLNGHPHQPPAKMPVALMDILAAHQMKEALLIGLWMRERQSTAGGGYYEVSLLESALVSLVNQATNWLVAGHEPQPMGLEHPNIVPYGSIYTTQDKQQIMLAVGSDQHFEQLCIILEHPRLIQDARFSSNRTRVKHRQMLNTTLGNAIQNFNADTLLQRLWQASIPAGKVKSISEALDSPEARSLIFGKEKQRGIWQTSFKSQQFQRTPLSPPPELGQHTLDILQQISEKSNSCS